VLSHATVPVLLLVVLFSVLPSAAQYPSTVNYQVMLTDNGDQPLADQTVELVFRVYENESGGTADWTETHNTTTNGIGVVSVELGSVNPLPFMEWLGHFWLEVEVNGETMSPRRRLSAAPYSFMSFDTMRFNGLSSTDFAMEDELSASGTINSPSNPVDWTMLKNVPSGIADGIDDVGGAGDGYSLDAWDGDPCRRSLGRGERQGRHRNDQPDRDDSRSQRHDVLREAAAHELGDGDRELRRP